LNCLADELKLTRVIVTLSSITNFRKKLNPDYKAQRKVVAKPSLLRDIRLWMLEEYETRLVKDLEADDVLGILQTGNHLKGKKIIVSTDKDMLTIPGWNYNPRSKIRKEIDHQAADFNFFRQVLTGDTVDNYKGVPGIGPKKAHRILDQAIPGHPEQLWAVIVETYEAAGLTEEDALMNARMAYILRAENYNFEKEEITLWEPPK
jgi:DNA polymerase I